MVDIAVHLMDELQLCFDHNIKVTATFTLIRYI